ncbi:MAG TPA: hypothetical protein IAB35_05790 [Candidatus Faecimonas gallistercoris]|nr:hypothetical protein [Candidatus Faecimonas gallistercoris]
MKDTKENLTEEEQQLILQYIKQNNIEFIKYLPFFYSNEPNHIQGDTAVKVIEQLLYNFDEDSPHVQQQLYGLLDKLMDGVIRLKYKEDKYYFNIQGANQINALLLKTFSKINKDNMNAYFKVIADNLNTKINDPKYYNRCMEEIKHLYQIYMNNNHTLLPEQTSKFYNTILNTQLNFYQQQKKKEITDNLTLILPLTKKKQEGIIRGAKFKKIDRILAAGEYEQLGITKEKLLDLVADYDTYLNSLRKLRKENVKIDKNQINEINQLFVTGNLSKESLERILPTVSSKVRTVILDKYTQEKIRFLNKVSVAGEKLPRRILGYNYNNYKIGTQEKTYQNLVKIINSLTEEEAQEILAHKQVPKELKLLLPLLNYFEEFDENAMIGLLRNYPKILKQMKDDKIISEETINAAIPNFYNLLESMESCNETDNITTSILEEDIIKGIMSDRITSRNPKDYINTYLGMLQRKYTSIPPIEGEFLNYYYETARDADRQRLLIGKNCNKSCIGPGNSGQKAYYSVLNGHNADVLMIKKKETDEFVARSLCFRKGNYIVFAPIHDRDGISENMYQPGLLSSVAKKMLQKSSQSNDTLEYIFINQETDLSDFYPTVKDSLLKAPFPHADLDENNYLIGAKDNTTPIKIDPNVNMPIAYETKREKIKEKTETSSEELTRIKALAILLTEDNDIREKEINSFKKVKKEDYDEVYQGQDWYIGIKDNQVIEEVTLPLDKKRQEKEIEMIKNKLDTIKMLENNQAEIEVQNTQKK